MRQSLIVTAWKLGLIIEIDLRGSLAISLRRRLVKLRQEHDVTNLASANVILVGNFNPYIISPEWLSQQEIWKPDKIQLSLGALTQEGVEFRGDGTEWLVSSDRMMISSVLENCGNLAKKIIATLPHTPMVAVGSNFTFHEANEPFTKVLQSIKTHVGDQDNPQLFRWGTILHVDDVRVEMSFVSGEQGTTVNFNYHRPAASTAKATAALGEFESDRLKSQSILERLIS
jgi:hypothetical protein